MKGRREGKNLLPLAGIRRIFPLWRPYFVPAGGEMEGMARERKTERQAVERMMLKMKGGSEVEEGEGREEGEEGGKREEGSWEKEAGME